MERETMLSFAMPYLKDSIRDFSLCTEQLVVIAITIGLLSLVWAIAINILRECDKRELSERIKESKDYTDTKEYIFDFTNLK